MSGPEAVFNGMTVFYLILAIVVLAFAILLYPILRERSKKVLSLRSLLKCKKAVSHS